MSQTAPQPTVRVGYPFYPVVFAIPAVCFIGGLLTDLAYWRSAEMMWADFSAWLITTGVVFGFITLALWIVDAMRGPFVRARMPPWPHAILFIVVLALATLDMLVHTRDAWTSVVPLGLALSAAVAMLVVLIGAMGRRAVYRERVAVQRVEVAS